MLGYLLMIIYPGYSRWLFFGLLALWVTIWAFTYRKAMQKIWFIISLLLLLLCTWGILNYSPFQNWIVKKVTATLSQKLHTRVKIDHVDFSLFNKMELGGFLVEDLKKDTLLYAGVAKVNITDWFFIKDKATLKYLGLQRGVINLNRTDSVWNYQFLLDYFASPKSTSSSGKAIDFDLKIVKLENITFNRQDKWLGEDMKLALTQLDLDTDIFDLNKKQISINKLSLEGPQFTLSNYSGNKPHITSQTAALQQSSNDSTFRWNKGGWAININNILLQNGTFRNDKETDRLPYTDHFDGLHILFTAINGSLKNVQLHNDTLTTDLELATKERSGFEVKKIQARAKLTPELMEFNNLVIVTEKSKLGNYYAMRYKDFNEDMSSFLHSVILDGNFENTVINSDDLAYFAPELKTWKRSFAVTGKATGSIDNLSAKQLLIKSGNTIVNGDISLKGLPDIKNTFIVFNSNDLQTNYLDLVTLLPVLRNVTQPNLSKLGHIRFKGNFTGFITDFVAFGNINTDLGNVTADLNMKLPDNKPAVYSGKIASAGFNLGAFVNTSRLGTIALNGKVNGRGFKLKDLDADFDGKVQQLQFSGYNYKNITIKGSFQKSQFKGLFSIDDPNLKIDDLNGVINLAGEKTQFNFDALLDHANLKELNLTKENYTLAGHFKLDFTGNNIDNFLGKANVYNATLYHDSTRLSFDSLALASTFENGNKVLTIQSNEIEGTLTGQYKIMELPDAFRVFLNRYYPTYVDKPSYNVSDQDFSFIIKTRLVDDYVQLFDKKLKGFNFSTFSGNLKLAKNELNINADIPEFEYDKRIFNSIVLESRGDQNKLSTTIAAGNIALNDSLNFPGTHLSIESQNGTSVIQLKTSAGSTFSDAQLNATVISLPDGVTIHFSPSSFILNEKLWKLEKDGELTIRKNFVSASEVKFTSGNQEVVISTELDDETNNTIVVAKLKKVIINDITPFFMKDPRLEGVLTGTLKLINPFGKQLFQFEGKAEDFIFENKPIGNVDLKADANITTGLINFIAHGDGKENKFDIAGHYNYKDDSENQMDIDFLSDHFNINLLDAYIGSVFTNIQGDAASTLKVKGGPGHRYLVGSVTVTNGSFKVNYTQCKYKFDKETIIFNPDEIDIGTIQLKDTLNNTGTASGKMYHNFFNDFVFDNIHVETDKMLVLNTTKKDNSQFYGKVIGSAKLNIDGPVTNLLMKIDGMPSPLETDSSHIYLLTGTSREAGNIDYIEFIQFGKKMEDELLSKKGTNIFVDMNLTATPACKIDVILDEALGDVIKGRGRGQLHITVGTKEPLTIRGKYDITDGEYTFNFQTFLKKYFTIKQGSIVWDGDAGLANIDINAEYLAKNIDLSSISATSRQKSDLTIIAHLTGILNKPEVKFEFVLPPRSPLYDDYIARNKLERFKTDKNEMLKQVASLLLVNQFMTDNQQFLSGSSTIAIAANTIGGVVSGWLTGIFNKELEKATKGILSTYLDINSSVDLQNKAALLQAKVNGGLKILLNNRLVILIGGNIDYNNPYVGVNKSLVTPDITIEYTLTKDGRWKAVGFNRTSIVATDLTGIQRNKSGLKLTYHKDFDIPTKEERKKKRALKKSLTDK